MEGWTLSRLSRRDDPNISSISQLVSHQTAGRFSYRFQLRPQAADGFAQHYQQQLTAYERFAHSAQHTVPRPVFLDAERQVSLITYIEGAPVSEMIKRSTAHAAQLDYLAKCGAWLDAYHRSEYEPRKFRPGHTLKYYEKRRQQVLSGEAPVPMRPVFLAGIDKLADIAPRFAGQGTVAAIQHGDFHLRNLIWNDGQIAGIDISKDQMAPVGYDIAKILLDFTMVFRAGAPLPEGQIVHPETVAAFFSGYTLVGPDDPSVNFLLYARILATLNTVPAARAERTDAKERTLERLKHAARNAFGPGTPQPETETGRPVTFLLTKRSLDAAREGNHDFANAVQAALKPLGHPVRFQRNSPRNREQLAADALSLVHMSAPVGRNGLVFRRAYAGPFWHVQSAAARWDWPLAKATFEPGDIDPQKAEPFFAHWRDTLVPQISPDRTPPFVYMPLQGKLLRRRSFQRASPVDMVKVTLDQTDLPIRATLHPSEEYTSDERATLDSLQQGNSRFSVVEMPMHDALASCQFVVTQNSSAAFHAIFHEKPVVLFAGIDFQHIGFSFDTADPSAAFAACAQHTPPFRRYLYWYWALNCVDLASPAANEALLGRLEQLGWPLGQDAGDSDVAQP